MIRLLIYALICLIIMSVTVFGRQTEAERVRQEQEKAILDRRIREQEIISGRETTRVFNDSRLRRGIYRRKQPPKDEIEEDNKESAEAIKKIESLRAPNPEDFVKYQNFLSQPKTGIFRLFPDLDCESHLLVKADGDCADSVSLSWAYSFRQKDYSNNLLFDLRFKDGNLISDSFHSQGILTDLGDVPLEKFSISEDIKFLTEFKPETRLENVRKQFLEIEKGIFSGNHLYVKSVKAKENTTYAARLIAYQRQFSVNGFFRNGNPEIEKTYLALNDDKRIDLIVAFRIIRKEENGNITIIWKELAKENSPKLRFEKNVRLVDIKPKK